MFRLGNSNRLAGILAAVILCSCSSHLLQHQKSADMGLWPLCAQLREHQFVDLTHAFSENTPHWKGFKPMAIRDVYQIRKDGFSPSCPEG